LNINTFVAGLIQAVHVKIKRFARAMCRHNSYAECARELFKPAEVLASHQVCIEK